MSVPTGRTLTIQPGAIIKIGGCFAISGMVNALGPQNQRIVFTSIHGDTNRNGNATSPAPGDWGDIDTGDSGSTFEWCSWRYGGTPTKAALGLRLQAHVCSRANAFSTGSPGRMKWCSILCS